MERVDVSDLYRRESVLSSQCGRTPPVSRSLDVGVFGARGIPSTYGGYETFLTVLLPELVARGHRVTMYCRKETAEGERRLDSANYAGVARVILPAVQSKGLNTLSHGLLAATTARFSRHEVVLAVNVANACFTSLARASGQRVVLNTDGQEWLRGKWGRAAKAYFRGCAKYSGHACSALISDSDAMRAIYTKEFGVDSTVIPYCWTHLDSGQQSKALLDSLGLHPREYLLLAGRMNPENNIDRVVDAYIRSGIARPLLVLGAANYDSPIERHVRLAAKSHPGVILGGHIADRISYATLVRGAATYIHSHSIGGINPSLLEAMGCSARILALLTPFNLEALGEAGIYFSDFEEELPRMLKQADISTSDEHLRQHAHDRVTELFSLNAVADAYEALLLAVADRPPWRRTVLPTRWLKDARCE